jgi:hypothetical protein
MEHGIMQPIILSGGCGGCHFQKRLSCYQSRSKSLRSETLSWCRKYRQSARYAGGRSLTTRQLDNCFPPARSAWLTHIVHEVNLHKINHTNQLIRFITVLDNYKKNDNKYKRNSSFAETRLGWRYLMLAYLFSFNTDKSKYICLVS